MASNDQVAPTQGTGSGMLSLPTEVLRMIARYHFEDPANFRSDGRPKVRLYRYKKEAEKASAPAKVPHRSEDPSAFLRTCRLLNAVARDIAYQNVEWCLGVAREYYVGPPIKLRRTIATPRLLLGAAEPALAQSIQNIYGKLRDVLNLFDTLKQKRWNVNRIPALQLQNITIRADFPGRMRIKDSYVKNRLVLFWGPYLLWITHSHLQSCNLLIDEQDYGRHNSRTRITEATVMDAFTCEKLAQWAKDAVARHEVVFDLFQDEFPRRITFRRHPNVPPVDAAEAMRRAKDVSDMLSLNSKPEDW